MYSTDWFWLPQTWLDRGEELKRADAIEHPGSVEEISEILKVADTHRIPVVP